MTARAVAECSECGFAAPEHSPFCPQADTLTRAEVVRVMLNLETRMGKLLRLESELRGLAGGDGLIAAFAARNARLILRGRFWEWAKRLGVTVTTTRNDVRALVAELERARVAHDTP
jgi:hypothetical protein